MQWVLKRLLKTISVTSSFVVGLILTSMFADIDLRSVFNRPANDPPVGVPIWPEEDEDKILVLHADELKQLRWMTVAQLKALFNGRQGKFKIESSSEAYKELRWMSPAQLEAIFGTSEIPKE